jgi:Flp pilus assembly protein TadB
MTFLAVTCASLAAWCWLWVPKVRLAKALPLPGKNAGWLAAGKWWWCLLAGVAGYSFAPTSWRVVTAVLSATGCWWVIARAQSPGARREELAVRRELPVLVLLFSHALRVGAPTATALDNVCAALPGSAAARLQPTASRLRLGEDPLIAWKKLNEDELLAPLGRALARSIRSGAPVAEAVAQLAEDLMAAHHRDVEARARAVGVKAAVPLGVCFLPAFIVIGIVPLAVSMLLVTFN